MKTVSWDVESENPELKESKTLSVHFLYLTSPSPLSYHHPYYDLDHGSGVTAGGTRGHGTCVTLVPVPSFTLIPSLHQSGPR